MEQTDSCWRRGNWMIDGEEINQRTFMHDPLTRTTIRELTERGERVGLGEGGQRGKKQGEL